MSKRPNVPELKVMVASTVYGFEDQLDQICATFQGYGYKVLNSHFKTIPTASNLTNIEICLSAVESCDMFFGIIRPRYGAVLNGQLSITHLEMLKAIELNKPKWFIAHRDINVARQLLKQFMCTKEGKVKKAFKFKKTDVLDDIRLIQQYNDTILNDLLPQERVGHWVDEYFRLGDILTCIKTQFSDQNRIRALVEQMKKQTP